MKSVSPKSSKTRNSRNRTLKELLLSDVGRGGPLSVPPRRARGPHAVAATYDPGRRQVVVTLNTGVLICFAPKLVEGLENARPRDLRRIRVSPSGQGLHFPAVDADIFVPRLLSGVLGSRLWMRGRKGQGVA